MFSPSDSHRRVCASGLGDVQWSCANRRLITNSSEGRKTHRSLVATRLELTRYLAALSLPIADGRPLCLCRRRNLPTCSRLPERMGRPLCRPSSKRSGKQPEELSESQRQPPSLARIGSAAKTSLLPASTMFDKEMLFDLASSENYRLAGAKASIAVPPPIFKVRPNISAAATSSPRGPHHSRSRSTSCRKVLDHRPHPELDGLVASRDENLWCLEVGCGKPQHRSRIAYHPLYRVRELMSWNLPNVRATR